MDVKKYPPSVAGSVGTISIQFAQEEQVGIFKEFHEGPYVELAPDVAKALLGHLLELFPPEVSE